MMTLLTSEFTTVVNAVPITTAIAKSIMFPLNANDLNSSQSFIARSPTRETRSVDRGERSPRSSIWKKSTLYLPARGQQRIVQEHRHGERPDAAGDRRDVTRYLCDRCALEAAAELCLE